MDTIKKLSCIWIFRPNPHDEPRPESLRIFAHAHDTVEALLLQIANHWPDLHVINWELISVNDRIYTSLELQQGDYCLLVWSPHDLFAEVGSGVIVVENQVWNVAGGTVTIPHFVLSLFGKIPASRSFWTLQAMGDNVT